MLIGAQDTLLWFQNCGLADDVEPQIFVWTLRYHCLSFFWLCICFGSYALEYFSGGLIWSHTSEEALIWVYLPLMQVYICYSISVAANRRSTEWSAWWRELVFRQLLLLCCEAWSICWSCCPVPCQCCSWNHLLYFLDICKEHPRSMASTSSKSRWHCNGTPTISFTDQSGASFCAWRYLHETHIYMIVPRPVKT